jgi:branched-subunit amino acid transport protein
MFCTLETQVAVVALLVAVHCIAYTRHVLVLAVYGMVVVGIE